MTPRFSLATLVALAGLVAATSAAPVQNIGAATIRGHVLDDRGRPVPGFVVRIGLRNPDGTVTYGSYSNRPIDEHGSYELPGLSAGQYIVGIQSARLGKGSSSLPVPGIARDARQSLSRGINFITSADGGFVQYGSPAFMRDGRWWAFVPTCFSAAPDASHATPVALSTGETRTIDLLMLARPAASISGIVAGRAGPINDAYILLESPTGDRFPVDAFTGPDGRFGIVALPTGTYKLTAHRRICMLQVTLDCEGFPQMFNCDVGFEDPEGWSASMPLVVGDRDVSGLTVQMERTKLGRHVESQRRPQPAPATAVGTAAIDGVLRDDRGQPVPYVRVAILSADLGGVRATVSDDEGRFVFERLPAVSVQLLATLPFSTALVTHDQVHLAAGKRVKIDWRVSEPR